MQNLILHHRKCLPHRNLHCHWKTVNSNWIIIKQKSSNRKKPSKICQLDKWICLLKSFHRSITFLPITRWRRWWHFLTAASFSWTFTAVTLWWITVVKSIYLASLLSRTEATVTGWEHKETKCATRYSLNIIWDLTMVRNVSKTTTLF